MLVTPLENPRANYMFTVVTGVFVSGIPMGEIPFLPKGEPHLAGV